MPDPKPKREWDSFIAKLIEKICRIGWYGTVRVEVQNGQIRRVLVERSIMEPGEDISRE